MDFMKYWHVSTGLIEFPTLRGRFSESLHSSMLWNTETHRPHVISDPHKTCSEGT